MEALDDFLKLCRRNGDVILGGLGVAFACLMLAGFVGMATSDGPRNANISSCIRRHLSELEANKRDIELYREVSKTCMRIYNGKEKR